MTKEPLWFQLVTWPFRLLEVAWVYWLGPIVFPTWDEDELQGCAMAVGMALGAVAAVAVILLFVRGCK